MTQSSRAPPSPPSLLPPPFPAVSGHALPLDLFFRSSQLAMVLVVVAAFVCSLFGECFAMNDTQPTTAAFDAMLNQLFTIADGSGAFRSCKIDAGQLRCDALGSAAPAQYRVELDQGQVWISLVMADRWLSESIEATLMNSGDKLEELLEDELVEQGIDALEVSCQHFRSDDLLFTYRSCTHITLDQLTQDEAVQTARQWLMGYNACFSQIGDMDSDSSQDG